MTKPTNTKPTPPESVLAKAKALMAAYQITTDATVHVSDPPALVVLFAEQSKELDRVRSELLMTRAQVSLLMQLIQETDTNAQKPLG